MIEETPDFDHESFLVSTFMEFGGREFNVTVTHDGFSYWFDPHADNQMAATKDFPEEWSARSKVSDEAFAVIRDDLSHRYWSEKWGENFDKTLHAILVPIFWADINPQLSAPVSREP